MFAQEEMNGNVVKQVAVKNAKCNRTLMDIQKQILDVK